MSWLARSIANTLKLDDDDDVSTGNNPEPTPENPKQHLLQDDDVSSPTSPSRGVKEDISELTKTLKNQFWGVASFLAPPPQLDPNEFEPEPEPEPDPEGITGIRTDLAEIGGRFRSGISRLSNNINVSEITKMASNLLQLESDDEIEKEGNPEDFDSARENVVGVTDEVVAFARDIAMHPKTWLDFPLPENDSDNDDFDMSDAQQEHALAVEHLAPGLAALRFELCPGYMSESCFWKIYFVLLHPRLDKEDAEILSTSQIIKARAFLARESKNQTPTKLEDFPGKGSSDPKDGTATSHEESLHPSSTVPSENEPEKVSALELSTSTAAAASEIVKHPVQSIEIPIVDKAVIEEEVLDQVKDQNLNSGPCNVLEVKDEDDGDDWLKEESSEIGGASGTTIPIENEDDVSFSDLEEDDGDIPASYRKTNYSSDKDSRDWLDVEEIDMS
ncbi:BSD domain-containing protein [Abeliophyllum distichum]|uniref:BSD domain-containing protein n=1 Tax=Abeliophyllum distichum TaxID=126358 RepID=A0ABD1V348_9LAMI